MIKEQVSKGKKLGQKRLQCYLEQGFLTAGPRTGAGSCLLSCRSAKFISILYHNWKMLQADPLLNTCGRQTKSV